MSVNAETERPATTGSMHRMAVADAPEASVDVPTPRAAHEGAPDSAPPAPAHPVAQVEVDEIRAAQDHPVRVRLLAGLLVCAALLAALVILGAMAHYAGLFSGQVLAAGAALPVVVLFTLLLALFFLGQSRSRDSSDDHHHDVR